MARRFPALKPNIKASSPNRSAILERLKPRTSSGGSFSAPCLPALFEHYMGKIEKLFELLDRALSTEELANFRSVFRQKLEEGFEASPYSRFVLAYQPSATQPLAIDCSISIVAPSLEEQYQEWLKSTGAEQPFGAHADAKVLAVARELAKNGSRPVLDVGAGNGRNALELARLGLSVQALEPQAELAQKLRALAQRELLPVSVLEQDILLESTDCAREHYQLILLSEVTPHFSRAETAVVLPKLSRALAPGGTLLFNAFVAKKGYEPDELARQAAQSVWSTFFTRRELGEMTAPLTLISEVPCIDYERAHLPEGAWPPTAWYANWAGGHNLFSIHAGLAPIELCWLEYRKSNSAI